MSLKPELKRTLLEVLKKEGMPPVIDKTFNSIWDAFRASQPSVLSSSETKTKVEGDMWSNLERALEKFGVLPNYAKATVARLRKKFGESPSMTDIKQMLS